MITLLAVPIALLVSVAPPALTPAHSGLYGVVRKGPVTPVCRVGVACDGPARVTLLFSSNGRVVGRTRSSATGAYRIALPAGYYAVTTVERIGINRNIRPAKVHVRAGRFDRLAFFIDTGIR